MSFIYWLLAVLRVRFEKKNRLGGPGRNPILFASSKSIMEMRVAFDRAGFRTDQSTFSIDPLLVGKKIFCCRIESNG